MEGQPPKNPRDEILSEDWLDGKDWKTALPPGSTTAPAGVVGHEGDWYANKKTYADGRVIVQWYKRGKPLPDGTVPQDAVVTTQQGIAPNIRDDFIKQQAAANAQGQQTTVVNGHVMAWDPAANNGQGGYTKDLGPQKQPEGGTAREPVKGHPGIYAVKVVTTNPDGTTSSDTYYEDEQHNRVPEPAEPAQPVAGTFSTDADYVGIWDATTNQVAWQPNPNKHAEKPQPFNFPADQPNIFFQMPDGSVQTAKNPNYRPPTQLVRDASGRMKQLTQDADGNWVMKDVTSETSIHPADLPVLQAKYGEISQGLGELAQDLNRRMAAGEITPEEREQAFTAAHQQAQTQIEEINSVLSNSRQTWAEQVAQQQGIFSEAASRRGFAGGLLNQGLSTFANLAASSGPGHGAAIAGGLNAFLGLGQKYAGGMGGFPSMEPIPTPRALQQQQDVDLPGFGPGAATGPRISSPAPATAAPAAAKAVPNAPVGTQPTTLLPAGPRPAVPTAAPIQNAPAAAGTEPPPTPGEPGGPPLTNQYPVWQPPKPPSPDVTANLPSQVAATTSTANNLIGNLTGASLPWGVTPPAQAAAPPAATSPIGTTGITRGPGGTNPPTAIGAILGGGAAGWPNPFAGLGAAFGRGLSTIYGVPTSIGGGGWWDPHGEAAGMIGDGSDPGWAQAVQQALGGFLGAYNQIPR